MLYRHQGLVDAVIELRSALRHLLCFSSSKPHLTHTLTPLNYTTSKRSQTRPRATFLTVKVAFSSPSTILHHLRTPPNPPFPLLHSSPPMRNTYHTNPPSLHADRAIIFEPGMCFPGWILVYHCLHTTYTHHTSPFLRRTPTSSDLCTPKPAKLVETIFTTEKSNLQDFFAICQQAVPNA